MLIFRPILEIMYREVKSRAPGIEHVLRQLLQPRAVTYTPWVFWLLGDGVGG